MLAVSCKNIRKTYETNSEKVEALRGVDLEVKPGELLMIVGPSGAGKTTLISVIAGILTPTSGECLIYGENIHTLKDAQKTAFRGKNLGFVFQSFNLIPTLSCKENVAIPLILNNYPRDEAECMAVDLLAQMGIPEKAELSPLSLSGGQQQRVAIARGCIHQPKLIVCDEPTSYLDHETGRKVLELLRATALQGDRALIVVTHDSRIFDFADRIIKIEDGKVSPQ